MTQAFRLLGDPRCNFVELPPYTGNPTAFKYMFRNNLRASYIRNLNKTNPDLDLTDFEDSRKRRFVALHHFQPEVVQAFYENPMMAAQKHKVPFSITQHEVKEFGINMDEVDRILSLNGNPTGGFFFVPNYTPQNVHQDLKTLVRSKRLVGEARSSPQKEAPPKPKEVQFPTYSNISRAKEVPQVVGPLRKDTPQKDAPPKVVYPLRKPLTPKKQEVADDSSTEDVDEEQDDIAKVPSKDFDDMVTNAEPSGEASNFDNLWKERHAQDENDIGRDVKNQDEAENDSGMEAATGSPASALTEDENDEGSDTAQLTAKEDIGDQEVPLLVEVMPSDEGDQNKVEETKPHESISIDEREGETGAIKRELFPLAALEFQNSDNLVHSEMLQKVIDEEQKIEEDEKGNEEDMLAPATSQEEESSAEGSPSKLTARNSDHPWDLSKYRKVELETRTRRSSAAFIDPTTPTVSQDDSLDSGNSFDGISPRKTPAGMNIIEEGEKESSAAFNSMRSSSQHDELSSSQHDEAPHKTPQQLYLDFYDDEEDAKARNKYHASFALNQSKSEVSAEESKSDLSIEGISPNAIGLTHELPGTDPTLRIQVHNDLIALESRRRSEISTLLSYHKEKWQTLREILLTGLHSVEYAERLVSGFAQAGMMFADSLEAISEDRLLDDRGKTVKSSFVQNRLMNRRSKAEYSIDNRVSNDDFGQSALLKALIDSQITIAQTFDESARYLLEIMLPEVSDLKMEVQQMSDELDRLGEGIIGQLITSESEVKNIWDVFDALVTGDLMEYSVHGSSHGSMHGGSFHSVGSTSTSLHGLIPDSGSVVSTGTSAIKSKFKHLGNLGSIEDGWLVELIYKSAISCQKTVFEMAETELNKLNKEICLFEERRLQKLLPLMIAFIPRQRRLFSALPDALKGVLNDLVGMRIDEESLQAHIDETLKNRSQDRLKGSEKHRSSIMNRSRVKTVKDTPEVVNDIERLYGSPFFSSMIVLSKVVQLKPFGLKGIVKAAYKLALVVVTSDGNFHVFTMPPGVDSSLEQSPLEAFRLLYPPMEFESKTDWNRKADLTKRLTPSITLKLKMCNIRISNIRKRELDVIQEEGQVQRQTSFFGKKILKAVKDGGQGPTKCTIRLPTAADATEWAQVLANTKTSLGKR